jgi:hypothetical protein
MQSAIRFHGRADGNCSQLDDIYISISLIRDQAMVITVKLLDPKHPSANYQMKALYSHLFHATRQVCYFQVASISDRLYRVAALGNSAK